MSAPYCHWCGRAQECRCEFGKPISPKERARKWLEERLTNALETLATEFDIVASEAVLAAEKTSGAGTPSGDPNPVDARSMDSAVQRETATAPQRDPDCGPERAPDLWVNIYEGNRNGGCVYSSAEEAEAFRLGAGFGKGRSVKYVPAAKAERELADSKATLAAKEQTLQRIFAENHKLADNGAMLVQRLAEEKARHTFWKAQRDDELAKKRDVSKKLDAALARERCLEDALRRIYREGEPMSAAIAEGIVSPKRVELSAPDEAKASQRSVCVECSGKGEVTCPSDAFAPSGKRTCSHCLGYGYSPAGEAKP